MSNNAGVNYPEWRDVPGYEGLYQVSRDGDVYGIRYCQMKTPVLHKSGYLGLTLNKKGRTAYYAIHRLVASVFLGAPEKSRVRHENGNRLDNRAENLVVSPVRPKEVFVEKTPEERFWGWAKVVDGDACWEWTGAKNRAGYGSIGVDGKTVMAHRFSYMIHHGEIPPGLVVMHKCDNKGCVNPDHLDLGTYKDNTWDAIRKGLFRPSEMSRVYWSGRRKATDQEPAS